MLSGSSPIARNHPAVAVFKVPAILVVEEAGTEFAAWKLHAGSRTKPAEDLTGGV